MDVQPELCAICKIFVDTGVLSFTLTAKGSSTINLLSITRNDRIHTMPEEVVHQECSRKYCNPRQIAKDIHQEEPMPSISSNGRPVLQSSEKGFSFKTNCFFCDRTAKLGSKRKHDGLEVKTIETVLKYAKNELKLKLV